MRFLFVRPGLCPPGLYPSPDIRLPSDSASRRTPLPSANAPYCQARSGLSPPSCCPCRAHRKMNPPASAVGGIYLALFTFQFPIFHRPDGWAFPDACISREQSFSLHVWISFTLEIRPVCIVNTYAIGKCRPWTVTLLHLSTMASPPDLIYWRPVVSPGNLLFSRFLGIV